MDLGLQGKVVIVTGAGGGIGRQVALAFAGMDAHVVVCDIDGNKAEETFRSLADIGVHNRHLMTVADVSDVSACKRLVEQTVGTFGKLDILVNVAAILRRVPIDEVDEAMWDRMVNVNVKSQFFLSREACKAMIPNRWGRIVNFSSQGAYQGGYAGSAVYNITKGAIVTLTKSFARTYAEYGICVNAIAPGFIDTDMMKLPAGQLQSLLQLVPLRRLGKPDELTGAVLFLASDWASYITGATIDVTGGQLMR